MPGCSFGSKSNGVRHLGQKPLVRPGDPSRERPTGAWQTEQKRLSSATTGGSISAWRGSTSGIGGTSVSPAPRREILLPWPPSRVVRREPVTERAEPIGTCSRRLVTELERAERTEPVGTAPADAGAVGVAPAPLAERGTAAAGDAAAMPHTSQ